ncbi:MAG TPA: YlxR family protein [Pseudogracilibacillus sp.]|nr:YlxR family protein [Pseudogracilibacillus sp.]
MSKQRKIPQRKCIVTNEMKPKQSMIRIVRNKEGEVSIDPTGKKNGRGAYMTVDSQVIEKAKEDNVLAKTFQVKIDDEIYEQLLALVGDQDE